MRSKIQPSAEERKRQNETAQQVQQLRPKLRWICIGENVPACDIDELIDDAIGDIVTDYDPARGKLKAFAWTVLTRRIADHFKRECIDGSLACMSLDDFESCQGSDDPNGEDTSSSAGWGASVAPDQESRLAAEEDRLVGLRALSEELGSVARFAAERRRDFPGCEAMAHVARALATLDAELYLSIREGDGPHNSALADWSKLADEHMHKPKLCLPAPPAHGDVDAVARLASMLTVRLSIPGATARDAAGWLSEAIALQWSDLDAPPVLDVADAITRSPDPVAVVFEALRLAGMDDDALMKAKGAIRTRKSRQRYSGSTR